MKITQAIPQLTGAGIKSRNEGSLKESDASFGEVLKQSISDVNSLQSEAGRSVEKLVSGESDNLHDVMIAVEKAKTSFDLLMEIRNKAIDAYREMMRMQV